MYPGTSTYGISPNDRVTYSGSPLPTLSDCLLSNNILRLCAPVVCPSFPLSAIPAREVSAVRRHTPPTEQQVLLDAAQRTHAATVLLCVRPRGLGVDRDRHFSPYTLSMYHHDAKGIWPEAIWQSYNYGQSRDSSTHTTTPSL